MYQEYPVITKSADIEGLLFRSYLICHFYHKKEQNPQLTDSDCGKRALYTIQRRFRQHITISADNKGLMYIEVNFS